MLNKNEIKQLEEGKSFNINQAKKIIEHNEKNKRRRTHFADKQRKNQQEYLEALNKNPKTIKAHKTKAPLIVDFY